MLGLSCISPAAVAEARGAVRYDAPGVELETKPALRARGLDRKLRWPLLRRVPRDIFHYEGGHPTSSRLDLGPTHTAFEPSTILHLQANFT